MRNFSPVFRDEKRSEILGKRSAPNSRNKANIVGNPSTPEYLVLGLFMRNRLRSCLGLLGLLVRQVQCRIQTLRLGGVGGGGDHPDPPLDKGSPVSKNFFPLFGPQLGLKIRGGAGLLPWIRH